MPKSEDVTQQIATVTMLWFDGEGNGPDAAEAIVHAMALPTGPQVAVDVDITEDDLRCAVGRFSFYADGARELANALITAADRAESMAKQAGKRVEG
jgi:hypothetical protein